MNREAVFARLTQIFRDNFDDESLVLTEDTTADDIEDWDSLEQINLIVAIQQEFGIKLIASEVNQLSNVGKMVDMILKKQVNGGSNVANNK